MGSDDMGCIDYMLGLIIGWVAHGWTWGGRLQQKIKDSHFSASSTSTSK